MEKRVEVLKETSYRIKKTKYVEDKSNDLREEKINIEERTNIEKNEELGKEILYRIEKTTDEKLKNTKKFTTALLTIVTSIIAFILVMEVDVKQISSRGLLIALGVLLVLFNIIIVSFFGKINYKAIEKKTKKDFEPHLFDSYCYLSDDAFVVELEKYINRNLTDVELLIAKNIKQKINESVFIRTCVNFALGAVECGALIMSIACFILAFMP